MCNGPCVSYQNGMFGVSSQDTTTREKYELYEVIELSNDLEKRYKSLGLQVEVKKARMMRKQAKMN